jgi:serine O-acetyltransferase
MHERLKKRDQVRRITSALIQTFGSHQPKLEHLRATPLPDKTSVVKIVDDLLEVIYPGYFGWKSVPKSNLERHIGDLMDSLYTRLTQEVYRSIRPACEINADVCDHCVRLAEDESLSFLEKLADLRRRLTDDVQAAFDGDPAAKSIDEVIVAYPGVFAITVYRLAYELHVQGIPLLPRIMTEYAHSVTGIDIHPGAVIGSGFFIDHGTGVVIGETTTIGNRVKLYQGVTLGALSFPKDEDGRMIRGKKRHPTIEDDVVIYAGATILGGTTVIGRGSVIGGNVWLTRSVPPHSRIVISGTEI